MNKPLKPLCSALVGTVLLGALMLYQWPAPVSGAQVPQSGSANKPVAAADLGWPRVYNLDILAQGDTTVIYQPQIASWDNEAHIVAWSAVAYQPKDAKQPAFGTIKLEADTSVALDARLVEMSAIKITEFKFPSLSPEDARKVADALQQLPGTREQVIALDRVLANLERSQIKPNPRPARNIKNDPPKIFSSTTPAVVVNFDGPPIWSPIKGVDLKFAVNTNWDVFQSTTLTNTYYLRNDTTWLKATLKATDLTGQWSPAGTLPGSFSKLPADDNWKDVRANLPGARPPTPLPKVFVSFEPAELIALKGAPAYRPVEGTSLLWVSNTESDLFRMNANGPFFYLVAGRWFSAPGLQGPWTFATPSLSSDFKKIPVEHPRSRVLASVPGTDQATEAVLLASVPQTARVNKNELKAPEVAYQPPTPEFKPIESTSVKRAVNTDKDIFEVGGSYYMCFQGVWFASTTATGPWEVTTALPNEIYDIPASSPAHHVTYVTAEEDENKEDEWVTFEAEAGYTGEMVEEGSCVWGTGWYYPPYAWYGGYYPGYYWYPPTYGFSSWYNPFTGTFGRGAAAYGPYGGAGAWATYSPRSGTISRGASVHGPYSSRSFAQASNWRTGSYAHTRQGSNIYGNWGSSYVQRGDNWVQTAHKTNYQTGRTTTAARGSGGGGGIHTSGSRGSSTVARTGSGDVYAGHDGNVYRKQDGTWQKWENGGWSPARNPKQGQQTDRPERETFTGDRSGGRNRTLADLPIQNQLDLPVQNQLDVDRSARFEGNQRTRDVQNYSVNQGGRSSAGSYRPAGGGGVYGGGRMGGGGARFGGGRR